MYEKLITKGIDIKYKTFNESDYICFTNIAQYKTAELDVLI